MDHINPCLPSEIIIVLIAEESEFIIERSIIHDVIYPALRKYFMVEHQTEFNIIDLFQDSNHKMLPNEEKSEFILSQLKRSQKLSSGLSTLILLGDQCGEIKAPKKLTENQFTHVLNYLQSQKDSTWKFFNLKYTKSNISADYFLDENITDEENYMILNNIEKSISSKPNSVFPETFLRDHFTTILDKCISISSTDHNTISSTQIIRRITTTSNPSQNTKSENNFQSSMQQKYENLIKTVKKKYLPNNFIEYSLNNLVLLEAKQEIQKNKNKLLEISEISNFLTGKCRLLNKDLRITSTANIYLQIFMEHVTKILRESCNNLLSKNEISKDILNIEIMSHQSLNKKNEKEEFVKLFDKDRERERNIFQTYISSNIAKMPALIYGPIGSGKTNFILDLINSFENMTNKIVVIRHCGKTANSSNLQLVISSISDQINAIINKTDAISNACEYAVCVYNFWTSINKAGPTKPIIIILDDVENLFPNSHTDMIKWLPPSLPNGVKVILTSSSDTFYQGFKKRYEISNIINLTKTDPKESIRLLPSIINTNETHSIPETIWNQCNFCLQDNSTPLFLEILSECLDFIKVPDQLSFDIKSGIKCLLEKYESKSNSSIIKHILSYLALSRFGLSLAELTDILSLDNVIFSILEFSNNAKAKFRFPTSLSLYFLNKLKFLLVLIQTEGKLLISLKHQVYISTILEYYQLTQENGKHFYQILYEYWTSKYCGDKFKPLNSNYIEDEESVNTEGSSIYVKRDIAPQPYYTILKDRKFFSNQRKLLELPSLLIKFEKTNEICKLIIFNFEYLFATLNYFGINHLISEMYFTRQLNEIKNNAELELLLAQLRLLSTEVIKDAILLSPELSGRLSHLIGTNTLLSQLLQQIDTNGTKVNVLFSVIPCYTTIDIENMRIELGRNKELIFSALSPDNRFISTCIKDNELKEILIIIWDARTATKSQILNLGKFINTKFINMFYMPQSDEFVILQYEDSTNNGFFIINLEFSTIENSIKFPKNSLIKIEYLSKSNFYFIINGKSQIFTHPAGQKDVNLSKESWPTQMTPNDKYLIGPKAVSKKTTDGNKSLFNLRVQNPGSGEFLCQLNMSVGSYSMLANVRNEILFVGTKTHGIVYRFDIGQIAKKDIKSLKHNLELRLNDQTSIGIELKEYVTKFYPNIKVAKFQLSLDEKYLIVEYILNDSIRAFGIWNIGTKLLVQSSVLDSTENVAFSTDGQYFYQYQRNGSLNLFNLGNNTISTLYLKDNPEQVYMLRGGSFFVTFATSVKLTTLKAMFLTSDNPNNSSSSFREESFCTSIMKPKISSENIVIYSNFEETSNFIYFKLSQNKISTLDISHTNESLTHYSFDKFLSPDGEKLLLVFGFRLANLITETDSVNDNILTIPERDGQLINNINDYRKPQIPKENYFTGKYLDSTKKDQNNKAYEQKIIKIIDLQSSKIFFQVSLTGENILMFTDDILLTFKPDYASLTRNCEEAFDIVSIYDLQESQFISSIYLEHPVIDSALLPNDKQKLLICCGHGGKLLRLLGGKYFSMVLFEINTQTLLRYYDEFARSSAITKFFIFHDKTNELLLQYSWLDSTGNIKIEKDTFYAKIDIIKKEVICQFSTLGKITDVSNSGLLAIDSLMNVFDLYKGSSLRKLQNSIGRADDNNFVCKSLFSRDSNHIITLDSKNNTIWVIKNDDQCLPIGKALLTSSFENNVSSSPFNMILTHNGQIIIVYNESEFKMFVMRVFQKTLPLEYNYKSSIERIKKNLLP